MALYLRDCLANNKELVLDFFSPASCSNFAANSSSLLIRDHMLRSSSENKTRDSSFSYVPIHWIFPWIPSPVEEILTCVLCVCYPKLFLGKRTEANSVIIPSGMYFTPNPAELLQGNSLMTYK